MRIRITRDTVALNRVVIVGEVLDESCGLDEKDAAVLVRLGKAVEIKPPPSPEAMAVESEIIGRSEEKKTGADGADGGGDPAPAPAGLTTENAAALVKGKKKKEKIPTGLSRLPMGTM